MSEESLTLALEAESHTEETRSFIKQGDTELSLDRLDLEDGKPLRNFWEAY